MTKIMKLHKKLTDDQKVKNALRTIDAEPEDRGSALEELDSLTLMSTDELINEAAKYGALSLFSDVKEPHPNRYRVRITFVTTYNTEMIAKPDFGQTVPKGLIQAIAHARHMVALARELE